MSVHPCGACSVYPIGWGGEDWNCRRGGRVVSTRDEACRKFTARPGSEVLPEPKQQCRAHVHQFYKIQELRAQGTIYILDCGPYTKIGYTALAIEKRLAIWRSSLPFDFTHIASIPGPRRIEQILHEEFSKWRHRPEWFKLGSPQKNKLMIRVCELHGTVHDLPFVRRVAS